MNVTSSASVARALTRFKAERELLRAAHRTARIAYGARLNSDPQTVPLLRFMEKA